MVLTGTLDQPGVFCEKKIQDLNIGDLVWSKDQDDPDGALELKPITNLYRSVAHDLQTLSLADEAGNVEVLLVTDEHPFYAEGQGWTGASGLYIGQYVEGSDGRRLRVVENVDYKSDEGLAVYNLEVENGHTYFVTDGEGEDSWAWVHNACSSTSGHNKYASLGMQKHNDFTALARSQGYTVKTPLNNGSIPDAFKVLRNGKGEVIGAIVRELKSSRPASVTRGVNQLNGYSQELVRMFRHEGLTIDMVLQVLETY